MTLDLDWFTALDDLPIPAWVQRLAGAETVRPVWRNEDGGVTYRFGRGRAYLKAQRPGIDWQPDDERARLAWVGAYVPAPRLLGHGVEGDLDWLLTAGLPGRSAVDQPWRDRPEVAVGQLGRALRRFHDSVPVAECRFGWTIEQRVARFGLDAAFVTHAPPLDAVVCRGDACSPNFLLTEDGEFSGYVDLGSLGIADRWADLAPALLSLGWNYGPSWQPSFLDAYGIAIDQEKLTFYTDLWNGVADEIGRAPTE